MYNCNAHSLCYPFCSWVAWNQQVSLPNLVKILLFFNWLNMYISCIFYFRAKDAYTWTPKVSTLRCVFPPRTLNPPRTCSKNCWDCPISSSESNTLISRSLIGSGKHRKLFHASASFLIWLVNANFILIFLIIIIWANEQNRYLPYSIRLNLKAHNCRSLYIILKILR